MNSSNRKSLIALVCILVLIIAASAVWYFLYRAPASSSSSSSSNGQSSNGFVPFGRTPTPVGQPPAVNNTATSAPAINAPAVIPTLRMLSASPIGGYSASTTASTTVVRWVDRGRGNVYEVREDSSFASTLSNTVVPRVYTSTWNKNMTAFVGSLLQDGDEVPTTVFATLVAQPQPKIASTSSSTMPVTSTLAPYALKGNILPGGVIGYASSPKKDKIFMLMNENGMGAGYVASFDGTSMAKIFSTPLTQVNIDWPSDNVIAITTKGAADQGGFLYFVDPKTGIWKKILGPLPGLSTKVSHDGRYVFISAAGDSGNVLSSIYDVQKQNGIDAVIRTLADKCVWGNFYKSIVYCGVPSQPAQATYPDDWYKGDISFNDKIWQINAETSEIHQVASIIDQSDRVIDAFNLGLDPKDNYLLFMNKNDLSFWSLDLVKSPK